MYSTDANTLPEKLRSLLNAHFSDPGSYTNGLYSTDGAFQQTALSQLCANLSSPGSYTFTVESPNLLAFSDLETALQLTYDAHVSSKSDVCALLNVVREAAREYCVHEEISLLSLDSTSETMPHLLECCRQFQTAMVVLENSLPTLSSLAILHHSPAPWQICCEEFARLIVGSQTFLELCVRALEKLREPRRAFMNECAARGRALALSAGMFEEIAAIKRLAEIIVDFSVNEDTVMLVETEDASLGEQYELFEQALTKQARELYTEVCEKRGAEGLRAAMEGDERLLGLALLRRTMHRIAAEGENVLATANKPVIGRALRVDVSEPIALPA